MIYLQHPRVIAFKRILYPPLRRVCSLKTRIKQNFGKLLMAFCLIVAIATGAVGPVSASTGDYPDANAVACGQSTWCKDGSWYSDRGYAYRNCTDYVAWKLQSLGVPDSKTRGLGNGGQWAANASGRVGVTVNTTPASGAAAVMPASGNNPYGHVAFVESVNANDTITISEYNYGWGGNYNSRTATAAAMGFTQFVHFGVSVQSNVRSSITAARNADGRLEVFAVGGDGNIYSKPQVTSNGAFNSGWNVISAWATDVAATTSTDGRIELFYVGNDGVVWHRFQVCQNCNFSSQESLGGSTVSPAITAARNADGRVQVFAVGGDGNIYTKAQTTPTSGFGSSWSTIVANARDIAATTSVDGRIELFYTVSDGSIRHRFQSAANGSFGGEGYFGGSLISSVSAERNADGRVEVFAIGGNGHIYSRAQQTPNGAFSPGWNEILSDSRDIASVNSADGRIELLYIRTNRAVYQRAQTCPNCIIGGESNLGGTLR